LELGSRPLKGEEIRKELILASIEGNEIGHSSPQGEVRISIFHQTPMV